MSSQAMLWCIGRTGVSGLAFGLWCAGVTNPSLGIDPSPNSSCAAGDRVDGCLASILGFTASGSSSCSPGCILLLQCLIPAPMAPMVPSLSAAPSAGVRPICCATCPATSCISGGTVNLSWFRSAAFVCSFWLSTSSFPLARIEPAAPLP